jgi:hypothetical protein
MTFTEIATFDAARAHLSWPWISFDASGTRFAFAASNATFATRILGDDARTVTEGPAFTLPGDLAADVQAFALGAGGSLLAVTSSGHVVTCEAAGEIARASVATLAGAGFAGRALAFDRSGARLWLSAESEKETALVLLDARSLALVGVVRSAAFPPPAMHELMLHPHDDAVLLLGACGEEGTFARVAGVSGGEVSAIATTLDAGGIPAGFVGFSADGARVHLVEADELRTHAWPGLEELSSVELADDFVSSFSGVVLGDSILVDGQDAESSEDQIMRFDRSAIVGSVLHDDVPKGMWAGRLGASAIVTVEAKGEPVRGRVVRVAP